MAAIEIFDLSAHYGTRCVVNEVTMRIEPRSVTAFIGPSGCGKTTVLRTINRMHETIPGARVRGQVLLGGEKLYAPGVDPVLVRRRVGMVFQRPTPFPSMTIRENVLAGVRLNNHKLSRSDADNLAEWALVQAGLWKEVKNYLGRTGGELSGGQQQRLCIARAIAVSPEVLLMDEPCSALDPIATGAIEELVTELAINYTIVIVTHNLAQAARVSNYTAFFHIPHAGSPGTLIEQGSTATIFASPDMPETADYIAGRFG